MSKGGSVVKVGSKFSLCASEQGASAVAAVELLGNEDHVSMIQVNDKLKKMGGFDGDSKNKLQKEAERLVNPENLRMFFSDAQAQLGRQQERRRRVSNLPVMLYLFCNPDHFTATTATTPRDAVSVAIAVGGVLLEWNQTNLVIPKYIDTDCPIDPIGRLLFHADIHYRISGHAQIAVSIRTLITEPEEVEYGLGAVPKKAQLIENLIKVIAKYNRYYYFEKSVRNSHRFAEDCMKALGVKKHSEYTAQLHIHGERLMKGKLAVPTMYDHHEAIDDFVESERENGRLELLSVVDLEYLLFVYQRQFHDGDGAECERPNCKMVELRALLKKRMKPIFV